jgi:hypothetical protein
MGDFVTWGFNLVLKLCYWGGSVKPATVLGTANGNSSEEWMGQIWVYLKLYTNGRKISADLSDKWSGVRKWMSEGFVLENKPLMKQYESI